MSDIHIMVIEDDSVTATIIENLLMDIGYKVSAAILSSGKEALQRCSKLDPDLVLMDINLNGKMSAVEAAEQIRNRFSLPVIYLTPRCEEEKDKRVKLTGPFDYLYKPVDPMDLRATIEIALYKHHLGCKLRESERKIQSILEKSGDGIYIVDEQGAITEWNFGLETITGYKRDDVLNMKIWDVQSLLLPEESKSNSNLDLLRQNIQQILTTGQSEDLSDYCESDIRKADGTIRTIKFQQFTIESEKGFMLFQITKDITECNQQQEEIERQVKLRTADLEKANQALMTEINDCKNAGEQHPSLFEQVSRGRERLRSLSQRLLAVQETERRSIARELHDEIGGTLSGLKICLEMISTQDLIPSNLAYVEQAQELAVQLLHRVREMSLDLRPGMLDDFGLLPALFYLFERYSSQTNIQVHFEQSGINKRFDPEIETIAYRIIQENLTNVARYASVDQVHVRMWASQSVLGLQVEDKGNGFDLDVITSTKNTFGLSGMKERAMLIGGTLVIETAIGQGTRITAELPLSGYLERRTDDRIDFIS